MRQHSQPSSTIITPHHVYPHAPRGQHSMGTQPTLYKQLSESPYEKSYLRDPMVAPHVIRSAAELQLSMGKQTKTWGISNLGIGIKA